MSRAQSLFSFAGLGLIVVGGVLLVTTEFRRTSADRLRPAARAGIEKPRVGALVSNDEDPRKPSN